MSRTRRYQLQCPIARALDVLGDRWSLLILRDLHAGPAGFRELQEGLGVASNLLSTRLSELTEAGLIQKQGTGARSPYALTDAGRQTDGVLWELVRFGGQLEREVDPRAPGNLRTLALPLRIMLESVEDRPEVTVGLIVDGERFTMVSTQEEVRVEYGDTVPVDLVVQTGYEAILDVGEGVMGLDDFGAHHLEVVEGDEHAPAFLGLMAEALAP